MFLGLSFHWLFITFIPRYNLRYHLQHVKNLPPVLKAMIGEDIMEIISTTGLGAFAYMHPVTLAALLGFAIWMATGSIVGPIDRGTIDLTLSTPLGRKKFLITNIVAGMLGGLIIIGAMLLGSWLGVKQTGEALKEPYYFGKIVYCSVNLYAVYLVTLALSVFFSSICTMRSAAVGAAFGITLTTYMLHFIAEWWPVAARISFLGPMHYYRPIKIAAANYDPTGDILGLTAVALVLFIVSIICFSKRDIAVV